MLQDLTQTLIVEKVDRDTVRCMCDCGKIETLLNKGVIPDSWDGCDMSLVFNRGSNMLLVHSTEPYVPKRAREE